MWLSLINASTTPRIVPKISVRTDISIVTAHPWSSDVILSNTSDHFNVTILFPLWPVIIAGLSFLPYSSGYCSLCSQQLVFCIEVYLCFMVIVQYLHSYILFSGFRIFCCSSFFALAGTDSLLLSFPKWTITACAVMLSQFPALLTQKGPPCGSPFCMAKMRYCISLL